MNVSFILSVKSRLPNGITWEVIAALEKKSI